MKVKQKTLLRPLRLIHLGGEQVNGSEASVEDSMMKSEQGNKETKAVKEPENAIEMTESVSDEIATLLDSISEPDIPRGEKGARYLLKRTPTNYLLNQAYGLWVFVSLFILTLIMTRKVSITQYGVYAIAMAAFNTIAYIVAFGLEDATTTFVPRVLTEHGRASAAQLVRRLLSIRLAILLISVVLMLSALPVLATVISAIPFSGSAGIATGLRDPSLLGHITPIAIFVLGNGIASLLTAVYASQMRMRIVFIVGSITQLLILVLSFITLQLGWGIDSVLWLQAIFAVLNALIFTLWQTPLLLTRGSTYTQPMKPVMRVGIAAWLTNMVSGALLKQVSIILLAYFTVSVAQIAYFNLSFQLGHAASLLLVSGFGGVAGSALAAAFVGIDLERLARTWQTLIKVETLLAAPVLIFCLFNAQAIAHILYGSNYDPVGPLLALFLFFNIITRILGTTIHQSTLYVLGKSRLVVLAQFIGLIAVIALGIILIPHWGPAGALVADGFSQIITGGILLTYLSKDLPERYPIGFTLRILLALTLAALPGIIWHPSGRFPLVMAGIVFLVLSLGFLLVIKPLSSRDLEMVGEVNTSMVKRLKWFGRGA
ncbi:MAG TPA: oligosaccharide flippase family protein [Ktedonobacteraceae bacterium]|nr:oligosaccharide flippase family protein [Ktedonobacteraceae bacterium]